MALITDLDDRTLVEQHRAGDPDAFRRIVVRHHRSLYSNALRRLGDPVAAEDAVQDALLRAFRNLERFDGDYHLDAWLHRIVTNTCHDIGRRRGRDTRLFNRACTEVEVEGAPADEALEAMPVEQITNALDSLPESYREVLMLRFVDELSYADVAERVGITEQNARARVSRGRTMLKRMLASTSALLVWAIPPLRRQAQLSGAEAEAANQAVSQVHGLATIAASAPAPTQAFAQVSGIIAQAGPAFATAAPAVSSSAPTLKAAALAVGIAASVAIPAGVAVDRNRHAPQAPVTQVSEDAAQGPLDAPVVAGDEAGAPPAPPDPTAVRTLSAGGETTVTAIGQHTTSSTTSTPTTTTTSPAEPSATTTTTAPPANEETAEPAPAPAPTPTEEPAPAPAPAATPGQLSASLSVEQVNDTLHLAGPLSLQVGETALTGQLSGKLTIATAGKDPQAPRQVERSTLRLELDDGSVLELKVHGESTVTRQGNEEHHALVLTFVLPGGAAHGLAEDGELRGTLLVRGDGAELGLAIPGAPRDS